MQINYHGSLSDPTVKRALATAQEKPEKWTVYLVQENGQPRTLAQNRLYQTLLRKFAQQQGRSVQYWNDFLVERFLGFEDVITEDGYLRKVLVSTTTLTVEEFSGFLNACLSFASENQVR